MQVSRLSAQLGLESELVELVAYWFTFGENKQSITLLYKQCIHPLKVFYPRPAETMKIFGHWTHKNPCTRQVVPWFSRKRKSLQLQFWRKLYIRLLCIVSLLKGNLQSKKRLQLTNFPTYVLLLFEKGQLAKIEEIFWLPKIVTAFGNFYSARHHYQLFWHARVSSTPRFCVNQEFEYPARHKARVFIVSSFTKSHVLHRVT